MNDFIEAAAALGREHGKVGGSWVFDGNTMRQGYEQCIQWDEEGDPAWWDHYGPQSGPLSGEWADGLTPGSLVTEIVGEADVDYSDEEYDAESDLREDLCSAYEDAYYEAWHDEVMRAAIYHTTEERD